MNESVGYWIIGHYGDNDDEIDSRISDKDSAIKWAEECSKADKVYCSVLEKSYVQTEYFADYEKDEIYEDYEIVGEELVWTNNPKLKSEVVE